MIIPLDMKSSVPLYEQIYEYIRNEIKSGKLIVSDKLPSTRSLSESLAISRSTVELAYHQLLSEGYIESIPKSGYYVQEIKKLHQLPKKDIKKEKENKKEETHYRYDFSPFYVDRTQFPYKTWKRLNNLCLNNLDDRMFLLGDNRGELPFRQAIADYLYQSRGVLCEASDIIVGAGMDYLLMLLVQLLPGEKSIAVENPGYQRAIEIFRGFDYQIQPIPVDENGMSLSILKKSQAQLCYVTPAHQYPLGVIMPVKKRQELLLWAHQKENRYIIEDDHDSEFRYVGKPIPALCGMEELEKVIYIGTFSRAIAPAIRVAYMVLPKKLNRRYESKFSYYSSTVSRIDQAILCEFLKGGYYERHVNRMRTIYKTKHDFMMHALKCFGKHITISGGNAGLHLVIRLHTTFSEERIIALMKPYGIRLYGLKQHIIGTNFEREPVFLVGFGNLSLKEMEDGIICFYQACLKEEVFGINV